MIKKLLVRITIRRSFGVQFTALLVGIHGGFLLATTLLDQLTAFRHYGHSALDFDIPLIIGLSLMYLSSVLMRRKWTAWIVAIIAYSFMLGLYTVPFLVTFIHLHALPYHVVRSIVFPIAILVLLVVERRAFIVRSDFAAFKSSLKFTIIILLAALLYGTSGFLLLNNHDFHQRFSIGEAVHRTIDQVDLTTNKPLRPYTKRAHIFMDSLSIVSYGALIYVVISLFQPLRSRWHDPSPERQIMTELLMKNGALSEEYFKLWPHDKQYYFNQQHTAGLAFRVHRGVALCMGDPVGDPKAISVLLTNFKDLCFRNDWLSAFIHTEARYHKLYLKLGYSKQIIGQEAIVYTDNYLNEVINNKYFRHIRNRFERESYTSELLQPPHNAAILARLKNISNEWLARPGRVERRFVMGYFSDEYMQQCSILVARDAAGTIQGFMNQVPAEFDKIEATFDILRQTDDSLGNTNDYLMMNFLAAMANQGYKKVNLGLSPLVGIDKTAKDNKGVVDNFLSFAYANGDRFYSFSGLHRFKAKYEPQWRDRYIIYRGGLRGFARTMNALIRVMQVKKPH